MTTWRKALTCVALVLAVLAAMPAAAQVTTGTLAGQVFLQEDKTALPGIEVTAVHGPTGTRYQAVTGADGRFTIPNVRVGGPYTISASPEGFNAVRIENVTVALGQEQNVAIAVQPAAVAEAITVTATFDPLINADRTGASSAVSTEQLETLPTVRRTLQDMARTNPYFIQDPSDASATRVSVAGRNNRYNSIQIDGAVNNDLFGLSDTGTPGGSTDSQPISMDAIQEIQLVVSPYDVRQGGFTGGGINAITRSGSNDWHASLYGSQRDESWVGELDGRKVGKFSEDQYGLRLGGPIMRDKLFFFLSGETNSNDSPTGFSANGTTAQVFRNPALAQGVLSVLQNTYGYTPGGLGEFSSGINSDLAFLRFDWNANNSNQVTLRHNYVDADKDRIESSNSPTTSRFPFDSYFYNFTSKVNQTVLQVNSTFGSSWFNEGRIGYQTIREERAPNGGLFPDVTVSEGGLNVYAGVNRFSQANALDQDILEITDDATLLAGSHTITLGTHNELFKFRNLFLDALYGAYTFNSLADLEAGRASVYAVGFSNTSKNDVEFNVRQYGLYGGDQWRMNDRFTLNYGLRVDIPTFPDSPSRNPLVYDALGIDTSDVPSSMLLWQPRVGFNWAVAPEQQVRGGVGIFAGRTPYVWISNNYQNSGVEFTNLTLRCSTPGCVTFDPNAPPPRSGAGALPRIDAIDPDFKFPEVMRATLGYDTVLFGIETSVEGLWSQTVKDAYYENANLVQNGTLPDGRPRFGRRDPRIDAVYLLKNTSKGEEQSLSLSLRKRFGFGLDVRGQYVWNNAESVADLTSSRAVSNFNFSPQYDPTHPEVGTSFFEFEHRFVLSGSWSFKTGSLGHNVGLYYNALSGAPYTFLFGNDVNGDTSTGNDLFYVPASQNDVVLGTGTTWEALNSFIESEDCLSSHRGEVVKRNSCATPWTHQLDFHYGLELPIKVVSAEITFDVLNLMNLIDSDKGRFRGVSFNTYSPVNASVDPATGRWVYTQRFNGSLNPGTQYTTQDLRSRWQGKLGLRVSF